MTGGKQPCLSRAETGRLTLGLSLEISTMRFRALVRILFGVALALLGSLWLLQGADLVHIRPILCVADCKPLEGGSVGWMTAGAVVFGVGVLLITWGVRGRRV